MSNFGIILFKSIVMPDNVNAPHPAEEKLRRSPESQPYSVLFCSSIFFVGLFLPFFWRQSTSSRNTQSENICIRLRNSVRNDLCAPLRLPSQVLVHWPVEFGDSEAARDVQQGGQFLVFLLWNTCGFINKLRDNAQKPLYIPIYITAYTSC